jgi:protein SCO1/2
MKNKSYIGISFIILIFGIWAVPKIEKKLTNNKIVKYEYFEIQKVQKDSMIIKDTIKK